MRNTHKTLLSAVIATLVSTGVIADDHKFEATAGAGGIFFGDPIEDSAIVNLGLGYVINDRWTLEAVGSRYNTELEDSKTDLEGEQLRLDALYNIETASAWKPYLAFGLGDHKRTVDSSDSARDTLLNLGVGLKRRLADNWEFRTDIRAFNSLDEDYTDLTLTAGISYLFGATPVKAAPMVKAVAPVVVKDIDSDGDGVFDSKDKCPDTPAQYKVDAVGCPMELTESVAIKLAVKFDTAKSIVKDQYLEDIGNLAKFMNQYANTVVTVEGHTDSQGSDAYNQTLSQSRAEAVKQVLINKFSIGADRVKAIGFGEAKPAADNKTAVGREENRRVVGAVSTDVTKKQAR